MIITLLVLEKLFQSYTKIFVNINKYFIQKYITLNLYEKYLFKFTIVIINL